MSQSWSWEAVDARLADPHRDLSALAAALDVPIADVARFASVREVLLAGRASGGGHGTDLDVEDLRIAGVTASDITVYLRVSDRVLELGRAERCARQEEHPPA